MCQPSARRAIEPDQYPTAISTIIVTRVIRVTHLVFCSFARNTPLSFCSILQCCMESPLPILSFQGKKVQKSGTRTTNYHDHGNKSAWNDFLTGKKNESKC